MISNTSLSISSNVARSHTSAEDCPTGIPTSVYNITIFYDCPPEVYNDANTFTCPGSDSDNQNVFYYKCREDEVLKQRPKLKGCGRHIQVPADDKAARYLN